VGADACVIDDGQPVRRCDLSNGILTDETINTVTFNLSEPDPNFIYKLAMAVAYPVPEGVSMNALVERSFPGTGPYVVTAATDTEVRLTRNPHFQVWDAAVRPDGFPDEIVFSVVEDDARRIAMVENGEADFTSFGGLASTSPELFARIKTQYAGQLHVGSNGVYDVAMNTATPPFDNVDARRAVNFAIDRLHLADLIGGPPLVATTCQILTPGFPGYEPYCPYSVDPDPGGHWKAPDLETAHRLVASSGTAGAHVVVGPVFPFFSDVRDYLGSVLGELGYDVSIDNDTDFDDVNQAVEDGKVQIFPIGFAPDFLAPSNFFSAWTCADTTAFDPSNFCDPEFDRAFKKALDLQTTDPSAATAAWIALDHLAVDLAIVAPLYNAGGDFVSAKVGNFQFSPTGVVLFDQLWVQ
jgi:peptide/nickel transport system substrate-binding protein